MAEPQSGQGARHPRQDRHAEPGKMADVVLWNGNPFSDYTRPERVWIDGALMYDANDPQAAAGQRLRARPAGRRRREVIRAVCSPRCCSRDGRARWLRADLRDHRRHGRARRRLASRSRTARSSSATAGSSPPATCGCKLPAGTQVIDATRQMGHAGHRRRLLAARPRRGRPAQRATASDTDADDRPERPVQRRDRRRPGDQPARHDHRRQPRRRRHPRDRRAERRQEHLRRAGRGDRHRRRHGPDHRARGSSSSSSSARPAPTRPAARAPRPTSCSATRCARPPSCAVMRRRSQSARGAAPDERDRRSSAIPTNRGVYGPDARRSEDVLLTRFDAAALVPVLQGRQYLLVHVERASDILQVLDAQARIPGAQDRAGRRERRLDGRRPDRARRRSGDRLGGQRPARQRSSRSPRPSRTSAGCAPPASRCRSG